MKRNLYIGGAFLALLIALGAGSTVLQKRAVVHAAGGTQAPRFEVDPMWPKPLPNHWLLGQTIGVSVDSYDHIWIIHRAAALDPKEVYAAANPPASECCNPAPPVLEFDEDGNLIGHWAVPVKAMIGRIPTTASRSTIKAMSGLVAMVAARRPEPSPAGRPAITTTTT
jgi:hypothetical protein